MNMDLLFIRHVLYGNQKQSNNAMDFVVQKVHDTIFKNQIISSELSAYRTITDYLNQAIADEDVDNPIIPLIVGKKSMEVFKQGNCILKTSHINKTSPKIRFKIVPLSADAKSDDLGTNGHYWSTDNTDIDIHPTMEVEDKTDAKIHCNDEYVMRRLHEYRDKLEPLITDEIRQQYPDDIYAQCLLVAKDYYSNKE